jgi:two-component system response regulator AtoC
VKPDQPVLFIANGAPTREGILEFLERQGCRSVVVDSVPEALSTLATKDFSFTLVDLSADGADDPRLAAELRGQTGDPGALIALGDEPDAPFTAVADVVIPKRFTSVDLDAAIEQVQRLSPPRGDARTVEAVATIRREMQLWRSPAMQEVANFVREASRVDITVLVMGETGAGKDVVARGIHYLSSRRSAPFVKVNCAAVPRDLLESELFGHERGAFTGAHSLKIGKFESANGGTIFLDEIGDLHPDLQGKLLHVLQDGHFSRLGAKTALKADVRVIAATNQDLERATAEGRFRDDLYYRLNVLQIVVPPLRERPEEIPVLADYFAQRYAAMYRRPSFSIPPHVMDHLRQQRYRGNVRELENVIKRMIILGHPSVGREATTSAPETAAQHRTGSTPATLKDVVRRAALAAEREEIRKVLQQHGWSRVRTAKALKISYRGLLYKMKRVGLRDEPITPRPTPRNGHGDSSV